MRNAHTLLRDARGWRRVTVPVIMLLIALLVAALIVPLAAAAPAKQVEPVLRIGYLGIENSASANGAQLAIRQINDFGGVTAPDGTVYQLELVSLDTLPTVETLPGALQTLLGQDVVALLGPDTNTLVTRETIDALVATGLPVFTAATGDALTDVDTRDHIFRIRAPERVYSNAIATYIAEDLNLTDVALVQTQVEFTEAMMNFENTMVAAGGEITTSLPLPSGSQLAQEVDELLLQNPEAIVMWGAYEDAATLLDLVRDAGWFGTFAYRHADEAARAGVLPDALAEGVLGFNSWSYAAVGDPTTIFLRDYVTAYAEVPGPLAVAAYDAMWFLRAAMQTGGVQPASLLATVPTLSPQNLVHGVFHPIDYGNGDLARLAVVYQLGPYGGPEVVARFDDMTRLEVTQPGAPPPTPIPSPTQPLVPTATLEGTWIEVDVEVLNVRSGPGFNYDRVTQINAGERYRVLGAVADYTWLLIDINGNVNWIKTEFVTLLGDLANVSIMQPPPTPTPGATATATLPAGSDIVIDTVVLNPAQPIPNRPFTATVTVRNGGATAAGRFAVAATWEPGGVYTASFVEGLAGGQSTQVQLSETLSGTGVFQVAVVADLNNDVQEANEDNNEYNITYRVDYPLLANQSNIQLASGVNWDLYGGTTDIFWDGFNLGVENGALIGLLQGVTYENVHYDMLGPGTVNNNVGYGTDQALAGAVFGVYTAEGQRAVLRIDNRQNQSIWITYRVYNSNP